MNLNERRRWFCCHRARTLLFGRHLLNECQVENLEIHFDRLSREYQFYSI